MAQESKKHRTYYAGLDLLAAGQSRSSVFVSGLFKDGESIGGYWFGVVCVCLMVLICAFFLLVIAGTSGADLPLFLLFVPSGIVLLGAFLYLPLGISKARRLKPLRDRHANIDLVDARDLVEPFTRFIGRPANELLRLSLPDTIRLVDEKLSSDVSIMIKAAKDRIGSADQDTPNLKILERELEEALAEEYSIAEDLALVERPLSDYCEKLQTTLKELTKTTGSVNDRPTCQLLPVQPCSAQ